MQQLAFPLDGIPSLAMPYINQKVNPMAISRLFEKAKARNVDLHAFEVYKDNELLIRMSLPPYDCTDKTHYYSLSKSFVSTAVGLACDEGLVSVDDRIVDLFPDKCPKNINENMAKCTVGHVLAMDSGLHRESFSKVSPAEDVVSAFLDGDFEYEPGTHFHYDTGATTFLAALVKKVTGYSVFDYLDMKMFRYMNIRDVYWFTTHDGTIQGGVGFHASCDDAAKLGLLYLNRGLWNGRRILSEEWVDAASSVHSDNRGFNSWIDWNSGYGYQFWRNSRGGYRGDGASGQYSIIMPDKNMVVAGLNESGNLQNVVDILTELSDEVLGDFPGSCDPVALARDFYSLEKTQAPKFEEDNYYLLEENRFNLHSVRFINEPENLCIQFSNGNTHFGIRAGAGRWLRNQFTIGAMTNTIPYNSPISEQTRGVAAAFTNRDGVLTVTLRSLSQPLHQDLKFIFDGQALTIEVGKLPPLPPKAMQDPFMVKKFNNIVKGKKL